jgi:hypothetical protein
MVDSSVRISGEPPIPILKVNKGVLTVGFGVGRQPKALQAGDRALIIHPHSLQLFPEIAANWTRRRAIMLIVPPLDEFASEGAVLRLKAVNGSPAKRRAKSIQLRPPSFPPFRSSFSIPLDFDGSCDFQVFEDRSIFPPGQKLSKVAGLQCNPAILRSLVEN